LNRPPSVFRPDPYNTAGTTITVHHLATGFAGFVPAGYGADFDHVGDFDPDGVAGFFAEWQAGESGADRDPDSDHIIKFFGGGIRNPDPVACCASPASGAFPVMRGARPECRPFAPAETGVRAEASRRASLSGHADVIDGKVGEIDLPRPTDIDDVPHVGPGVIHSLVGTFADPAPDRLRQDGPDEVLEIVPIVGNCGPGPGKVLGIDTRAAGTLQQA